MYQKGATIDYFFNKYAGIEFHQKNGVKTPS